MSNVGMSLVPCPIHLSNDLMSRDLNLGLHLLMPQSMSTSQSKSDLLERRFIVFAAAVISFSTKLPKTPEGRHVRNQILRSGTAAAANYGEARGAESKANFVHKLRVVFKELNETTIWLEIIAQSGLLGPTLTAPIVAENRELCRVIGASIKTARATLGE